MAWLNVTWSNRFPVVVTNGNTRGLAYFHAAISFTGANYTALHATAKSDYSDLRVTDSNGTTLLNFWLEDTTITNSVMLLVKVPQIPASSTRTIYVYFGNAAATSVSSATNTIVSANLPPLAGTPSVTIDGTAAVFNGPAMIHEAGNGNLVAVYNSGGSSNFATSGGVFFSTSTDHGATWAGRSTLLAAGAGVDKPVRSVKLTLLASGALVGWIQNDTHANVIAGTANSFFIQSTDNGATFSISTAVATPTGYTEATPYGQVTELTAGGDLIVPWYGTRSGGDTKESVFLMKCASGNNPLTAASWVLYGGSVAAATVMRDAGQVTAYQESDVVKISATTFLAVARVAPSGPIVTAKSTDTLGTWSAPANVTDVTGLTGTVQVSPAFTLLSDGNVLLEFAERTAQVGSAIGMGSSISTDAGTTWTQLAMPFYFTGSHDAGYSSTTQLSTGKLYTAVAFTNGAGGGGTTATLYGFTWDEDWAANPYGDYRDLSSTTSFTLGANASRDTTFGHSNTDSLKLDNNAGTGGSGATVLYLIGNQSAGYPIRASALNYWIYIDQNEATNGQGEAFKDGTTIALNAGNRILTNTYNASTPFIDQWFNGSVYSDWTVPTSVAGVTWTKHQLRGKVTSNSSATGGMSQNNVLSGNNATNAFNGTNALIDHGYWQAGSTAATSVNKLHVDDVYTGQWVAAVPTFSVSAEENAPAATTGAALSVKTSGVINQLGNEKLMFNTSTGLV